MYRAKKKRHTHRRDHIHTHTEEEQKMFLKKHLELRTKIERKRVYIHRTLNRRNNNKIKYTETTISTIKQCNNEIHIRHG